MSVWLRRGAAAWLASAIASAPVAAQTGGALLDVPFVSQTEALCGGAAAVMVMRYWGVRGMEPGDFAALVDSSREGIPTGVLVRELRARGWQAMALSGSPAIVDHHLRRGRPVITLVEVSPGRFHYVVVVGWAGGTVIAHDPAFLPHQRIDEAAFLRSWDASTRWSMVLLPTRRAVESPRLRADAEPTRSGPCGDTIAAGVALAHDGRLDDAERALMSAVQRCPDDPAARRELAGLRLLQRRFEESIALAREAIAVSPADAHAWRTLGTAHFLSRNPLEALDAWNRLGEPTLDLIDVDGLRYTAHRVATDVLRLTPGTALRPEELARARRRLADLPTVRAARLDYVPVGGGLADIDAAVVERPRVPSSPPGLAVAAARAALTRETEWHLGSPSGRGERVSGSFRWWAHRPRAAFELATPLTGALGGVVTLGAAWERQAYGQRSDPLGQGGTTLDRRSVHATLSDWASGTLRWEAAARLDRWKDLGVFPGIGGALGLRNRQDTLAAGMAGAIWSGSRSFGRIATGVSWRSSPHAAAQRVQLDAGITAASLGSPADLWPGAGNGHGRSALLRAHPLLRAGVLDGEAFGRRLAHGTVEYEQPLASPPWLRIGGAAFVDVGRAWRGFAPLRAHVDMGVGLRFRLPAGGGVRVDAARGLTDGALALSAGWLAPWPGGW